MNTIEKIKAKLQKHPHVKYETDRNSISVFPTSDDGFTVSLAVNPDSYTVSFNSWHEDFQSEEEALNCFAFGLSSDCRLKEYRRGNFAYKWTVESKENGEWVEDSTTGLFLFPFWLRKDVRYLQNDLINGERGANKKWTVFLDYAYNSSEYLSVAFRNSQILECKGTISMLKSHTFFGIVLIALFSMLSVNAQTPIPTPEIPTGLLLVDAATYQSIPLASTPLMGDLPPSADLSGYFPTPGNQGNQASCVAWAVAYALKSAQESQERNWRPNSPARTFSPAFIYNQIRTSSDCRGGTHFIQALNILRRDGVPTLADFPYSEADCSRSPDATVRQSAREFRIAEWRRVNVQDITEIKNHIAAGFPVLFGMIIDLPFWNLRGDRPYSQFSGVNMGAHAMVVVGYDDSKEAFKVINSWGTTWGDGGYGWISYTAFQQAVREGYVAQDIVVNRPPTPQPPSPEPVPSPAPPVNPTTAIGVPQIQHNIPIPNNLPPPFNVGMGIRPTGSVTNASGKTLQIVVRFAYQNGPALIANHQERIFRDVQGFVATGTPPIPVTTQNLNLADYPITIPYYALNLQPTNGQVNYNLSLSIFIYLDNYLVAQSSLTPFGLRW